MKIVRGGCLSAIINNFGNDNISMYTTYVDGLVSNKRECSKANFGVLRRYIKNVSDFQRSRCFSVRKFVPASCKATQAPIRIEWDVHNARSERQSVL